MDAPNPLVSTTRVTGTGVFDADGNRLGNVHSLMIGKRDGQVAYAIVGFGGWLGMAQRHVPVPWARLAYNTTFDGYVVDAREAELREAPEIDPSGADRWHDPAWLAGLDRHYGARS